MDPVPSLGRLLWLHSLAFLFLIMISVAAAGGMLYLHQDSARQADALNRMVQVIHVLRGDLYRQIKELFDYVFIGDPDALVEFEAFGAAIEERLARLREISADSTAGLEDQIEALGSALAGVQGRARLIMNQTQAGFPPRRLLEVFETELEKGQMLQYEAAFQATEAVVKRANEDLAKSTRRFEILASAALALPLLAGLCLLLLSRRLLRRQVADPVARLIGAAERYRLGDLGYRLGRQGPAEFLTLQEAFNRMAADLEDSQAALRLADKQSALGALVPIIAHNIRNPLASIRATAQVIDSPALPADERGSLEGIVRTVDRLDNWVSQLLNYLDTQEPLRAATSMANVAEQAIHMLDHELRAKEIELRWQEGSGQGKMSADRNLLEQAVCGLLANAIEAAPARSDIIVGIEETAAESCLKILDRGPGMPFAAGPSGFRPGPTTKARGSGLGVPFARKICELHGGELAFRTRPGGGTEALIRLPKLVKGEVKA